MGRLNSQPLSEATGQAADLFAGIKRAVGMVPNAYVDIGTNSPAALQVVLTTGDALSKGSLSRKEVEAVKLAISGVADCDYCLAAHSLAARKAGIAADDIAALREGRDSADAHLNAIAAFARTVSTTRGSVPVEVVDAVKAAGYSNQQIVETLLAIADITFTNLFNRVNDTVVDFPKV
ncbi:carboxymuconolactone decarboxylase family protein [Paraburkholderia sp. CNPSo 3157]|uniref:Carboxymuconolactone decarboxylase family protein n=1 Tax=Paraburkholderia franconis TaxID=2654983 RepID=A0A7X1N625_9BURK|nr:carboxymuconolactone decarboxylase family protein [Paraburkholderia franconis]MPW15666.1 carboxymuconolactone decarboxylase family protein [Paraburkholderia franconis]